MFTLNPKSDDLRFPPVELASRDGLLAIGGDLRVERLLAAYCHGIFPWYNEGQPVLWWAPDPRAVLLPKMFNISRSLRKTLRSKAFTVSFDRCFADVMAACAGPRPQHPGGGTWINSEMQQAYQNLHRQGHAHSVEVWQQNRLVGGVYGVAIGGAFFGESMFSHARDASKVALTYTARQLDAWGYALIDCQLPTPHLASLGAKTVSRDAYMALLGAALRLPGRPGDWFFDPDLVVC
jgi:leucyl/phenylalanyl-tRNA---protein transferase